VSGEDANGASFRGCSPIKVKTSLFSDRDSIARVAGGQLKNRAAFRRIELARVFSALL
jgi:hypothetical protein